MRNKSRFETGLLTDHLPPKWSISYWHHWLYRALPGAPYADLGKYVLELKERGFNAVRLNLPLTCAFRLDGTPRGPVDFERPVPGYGAEIDAGTGGRRGVLERLICLLELARKHDFWAILNSWESQNSICLNDPAVNADMAAVPKERRLQYLAQQRVTMCMNISGRAFRSRHEHG